MVSYQLWIKINAEHKDVERWAEGIVLASSPVVAKGLTENVVEPVDVSVRLAGLAKEAGLDFVPERDSRDSPSGLPPLPPLPPPAPLQPPSAPLPPPPAEFAVQAPLPVAYGQAPHAGAEGGGSAGAGAGGGAGGGGGGGGGGAGASAGAGPNAVLSQIAALEAALAVERAKNQELQRHQAGGAGASSAEIALMRAQLEKSEQMMLQLSGQMQQLQLQRAGSAPHGYEAIGVIAPNGGFLPFAGAAGVAGGGSGGGGGGSGGEAAGAGMHFMGASAPPQTQVGVGFPVPAQPFAPQGSYAAMPGAGAGAGGAPAHYAAQVQIPHGPIASPGYEFGGGEVAAAYPPQPVGGSAFYGGEAPKEQPAAAGGANFPQTPAQLEAYLARIRAERNE